MMTKIMNEKTYSLRDHPKMRYHGVPTWPPGWGGEYQSYDVFPRGEEGILLKVDKIEADAKYPERLGLTIQYRGRPYYGELWVEDSYFLAKIHGILQENIGTNLMTIGQLEI
ncbi:MAG: hypothetical protein M1297_06460 [Nitrospirae bacterium]|jgi:hypothetical protein|nr:hypothetical protein [Nitrospirota bacterium]